MSRPWSHKILICSWNLRSIILFVMSLVVLKFLQKRLGFLNKSLIGILASLRLFHFMILKLRWPVQRSSVKCVRATQLFVDLIAMWESGGKGGGRGGKGGGSLTWPQQVCNFVLSQFIADQKGCDDPPTSSDPSHYHMQWCFPIVTP